ncbi:glutaredoxin family protein [Chromatiaceae bacterium AAb-1]|nr:glutaredoxin family protein [Chromatiaceae bacterium AAb-1]
MPELILYSTWGCHLCEQAEALLQEARLAGRYQVTDIIDDEALLQRFRVHIPVLCRQTSGAEQLLFWPFDLASLQQWLKDTE